MGRGSSTGPSLSFCELVSPLNPWDFFKRESICSNEVREYVYARSGNTFDAFFISLQQTVGDLPPSRRAPDMVSFKIHNDYTAHGNESTEQKVILETVYRVAEVKCFFFIFRPAIYEHWLPMRIVGVATCRSTGS